MRLLLAEDDLQLGDGLQAGLAQMGYQVTWLRDGCAADRELQVNRYDVLVLDLGLPQKDGLELLEQLRSRGNDTPVLVLTARDTVPDKIRGLDAGADDYLAKPVDLHELGAHLRALVRRSRIPANPVLRHGRFALNQGTRELTLDGCAVELTGREYLVLEMLMSDPGQTQPRRALEERVYGSDEYIDSNALEVHVHNLRKKLGREAIVTIRGIGYMMPRAENDG